MSDLLISIPELRIASQRQFPDDDPYVLWAANTASDIVRDAASQPDWDASSAPRRARRIAMRMAISAVKHPDAEIAYGVGPLSGRYLEESVLGLVLTADDLDWLETQAPGGSGGNGLWVQPIETGYQLPRPIILPMGDGGSPVLYADPQDEGAFGPEDGD